MCSACKRVINYLLFAAALSCLLFIPANVNAQVNQVVNAGANTAPVTFPATDCVYKWLNSDPSIGLPAKGTGDIASFIAKNSGYAPVTATINARIIPAFGYQTVGTTTYAVDLTDDTQVAAIPVANASLQGTSPDGSAVYFMSGTDNHTLYKVDGRNNKLLATIPVSAGFYNTFQYSNINGLLFNPNGQKIYTYSAQARAVVVINTVTNAVENMISLPPGPSYNPLIKMSPDGTRIYLVSGDSSNQSFLTIVNTVTNSVASNTNLAIRAGQIFLTEDGTKLFISSSTAGSNQVLTSYDTITGNVADIPMPAGMTFMAISLDGQKVYFHQNSIVDYGYPIHILDIKTSNVTPANLGFLYNASIMLNPNGAYVYFTEHATGTIKVFSTTTDALVETIKQSAQVGINVTNQQQQLNFDGSLLYQTMQVSIGNIERRAYLQVIDTKTNKVIDSIPQSAPVNPLILSRGADPCTGNPVTFTITVNPPPPVITATGTLANVDAVYGTAEASTSFMVSGTNLPAGILVTPPAAYEVSIDGIAYSSNLTVGLPGKVLPTKVYVRLKLTTRVGSYSGNVALSSGTANATVPTVLSAVKRAPLVITAPITKKYGQVLNDAGRSTVFTAVGLKNNETIGGITIHYSAGAAANDAVGTYTGAVTASAAANGTFSSANYTIAYPQSDVIVEAAPLTITADDKERNYGEANPVLTFKYSGFVNNESTAQLTSLPVISTAAVLTSPAGQYPITISGAAALNYTFNYVPATFTIKLTPVTITTAFTPNGDGINDTWDLKAIGQYPGCTVEVMNRYGYKVFYSTGYPNAWDGRSNGANLPVGTYYYIIKLTSDIKPLTGYLTIIR
ncbi:MBG domain-containing protein [Mucilaginibacter sp. UYCu711]|uniref:MBG domain-containing protein n=1 Tax=Mucilaginibacter sp. UYCu711 TaxID=3156339 RepID=UPI003D24E776